MVAPPLPVGGGTDATIAANVTNGNGNVVVGGTDATLNVTNTANGNVVNVDPMNPTTVGALLAEEWTVHSPSTILPSFLERTMIEEAKRSGYMTFQMVYETILRRLELYSHSSQHSNHSNSSRRQQLSSDAITTTTTTTSRSHNISILQSLQRICQWISQHYKQSLYVIVTKLLKPYGPEIRFFIMYMLERRSLLSSSASSALLSETLYGCKRVKLGTQSNMSSPSTTTTQSITTEQRSLHPISRSDGIRLAFLVSVSPYLEERSDTLYEQLQWLLKFIQSKLLDDRSSNNNNNNNNNSRNSKSFQDRLRRIINSKIFPLVGRVLVPLLRMTYRGSFLYYRWMYLIGQSVYYDPYSRILNLIVRRTTLEDYDVPQEQQPITITTTTQNQPTEMPTSPTTAPSSSSSPLPSEQTDSSPQNHDQDENTIGSIRRTLQILGNSMGGGGNGGSDKAVVAVKMATITTISALVGLAWVSSVWSVIEQRRNSDEDEDDNGNDGQADQSISIVMENHNDETATTTTAAFSTNPSTIHRTSRNSGGGRRRHNQKIPPPPSYPVIDNHPSSKNSSGRRLVSVSNLSPKVCPICHHVRINPTASSGGYVFCLKCLVEFLQTVGPYCPVTGVPCRYSNNNKHTTTNYSGMNTTSPTERTHALTIVRLYEPTIN